MLIMASIVVFITTYSLVLPAITMEKNAICGLEEHPEHTADCYTEVLICGQEEYEGHAHTDECYAWEDQLTCTQEEHMHTDECLDEEGNLVCTKEEHTHGEDCYESVRTDTLICGQEASEGHTHSDACRELQLTCGKENHQHHEGCYAKEAERSDSASGNDGQEVPAAAEEPAAETPAPTEAPAAEAPAETPAVTPAADEGNLSIGEPEADGNPEQAEELNEALADGAASDDENLQQADAQDEAKAGENNAEAGADDAGKSKGKGKKKKKSENADTDTADGADNGDAARAEGKAPRIRIPQECSRKCPRDDGSAAPLPEIIFEDTLVKGSGIWYQTTDNTWEKVSAKKELRPWTNVMVRVAFKLKKHSLDAGNAAVTWELPEGIRMSAPLADEINDDSKYLNQIISGNRYPDEAPASDEYLIGKYTVTKNTDTKRWYVTAVFNDYAIQENTSAKLSGWFMFYMTAADLQTNANGKGSVLFRPAIGDQKARSRRSTS